MLSPDEESREQYLQFSWWQCERCDGQWQGASSDGKCPYCEYTCHHVVPAEEGQMELELIYA